MIAIALKLAISSINTWEITHSSKFRYKLKERKMESVISPHYIR